MSNSLCKSFVFKAYQDVIADVIMNVRDHFLEDGVDETVLQELKSLWETKLAATKAVEETKEVEKVPGINTKTTKQQQNYNNQISQHQNQMSNKQVVGQVPPNNHMPQGIIFPQWKRVPVQLTIPSPPESNEDQRVLGIEVPEIFLQGHHLKSILTGPIISATMNLPILAASAFLQDHVNNAFLKHQQSTNFININMGVNPSILQSDGACSEEYETRHSIPKKSKLKRTKVQIPQGDAPLDSSDDDDIDDDDDDIDQDDREFEDVEEERGEVTEEEPLNSGDDVSDADGTEESFETDNVIVCQYDKITRARNRWKFHLKDGIMNLNGEDYVFQKANGDAEW